MSYQLYDPHKDDFMVENIASIFYRHIDLNGINTLLDHVYKNDVKSIMICSSTLDKDLIKVISDRLKDLSITNLVLSEVSLRSDSGSNTDVNDLINGIKTSRIDHLDLSNNNLCQSDIISLFKSLGTLKLKHFNICRNVITSSIRSALCPNRFLTSINLCGTGISDDDLFCILDHAQIETLIVSKNRFTYETIDKLCKIITDEGIIHNLNMSSCNLNNKAMLRIADLLIDTKIKFLNLRFNNLNNDGITDFFYKISKSLYIYHISLCDNNFTIDESLHKYIRSHVSLRSFMVRDADISSSAMNINRIIFTLRSKRTNILVALCSPLFVSRLCKKYLLTFDIIRSLSEYLYD
jgi:hypothetical protein